VIQHSTNGQLFTDLGEVAANNRPGINNYQFIHTPLMEPVNYYRLRMVDINGSFTYSEVKVIRVEAGLVMQVFPNPAQQFITVKGIEAKGIVQIVTTEGKLVKQYATTGSSMFIDLGTLPAGMYIVWYKNHNQQQQQMIIKE
jgi:hypothetical protein